MDNEVFGRFLNKFSWSVSGDSQKVIGFTSLRYSMSLKTLATRTFSSRIKSKTNTNRDSLPHLLIFRGLLQLHVIILGSLYCLCLSGLARVITLVLVSGYSIENRSITAGLTFACTLYSLTMSYIIFLATFTGKGAQSFIPFYFYFRSTAFRRSYKLCLFQKKTNGWYSLQFRYCELYFLSLFSSTILIRR